MRSLLVLVLLAALAGGAYFSRPTIEAHRSHAEAVFATERKEQGGAGDIGSFIGGVLEEATRKDKFEDLIVATKYTASSGDKTLLECWGVFSQFLCSTPK